MEETNIDVQGHQPDDMQELESFLEEAGESSPEPLTDLQIAEKKVEFYKGLANKRSKQKPQLPEKKEQKPDDLSSRMDEQEQRVELRMQGYSVEEIREMSAYAKGRGISLPEAEKSGFVKSAILQIRAEQKSKEAVLEPGSSNVMVGSKDAQGILADPKASPQEKQAAMEAIRTKRLRG